MSMPNAITDPAAISVFSVPSVPETVLKYSRECFWACLRCLCRVCAARSSQLRDGFAPGCRLLLPLFVSYGGFVTWSLPFLAFRSGCDAVDAAHFVRVRPLRHQFRRDSAFQTKFWRDSDKNMRTQGAAGTFRHLCSTASKCLTLRSLAAVFDPR